MDKLSNRATVGVEYHGSGVGYPTGVRMTFGGSGALHTFGMAKDENQSQTYDLIPTLCLQL